MARDKLPTQTPIVPRESFIAFDLLYRFLQQMDRDLAVVEAGGGGGGGDHGGLTGLADDDHPQYHNDTRGDARYILKTADWQYVTLAADHNNSTTTLTDIPGLAILFPSAGSYEIEGKVLLQTAALGTQPQLGVAEPNNANGAWINFVTQNANSGFTSTGGTGATNGITAAGTARNINLPMLGQIDGFYIATAASTVAWRLQLRSETALTQVRCLAGSFLRWRKLP